MKLTMDRADVAGFSEGWAEEGLRRTWAARMAMGTKTRTMTAGTAGSARAAGSLIGKGTSKGQRERRGGKYSDADKDKGSGKGGNYFIMDRKK